MKFHFIQKETDGTDGETRGRYVAEGYFESRGVLKPARVICRISQWSLNGRCFLLLVTTCYVETEDFFFLITKPSRSK